MKLASSYLANYENKWVAVDAQKKRVLASGNTPAAVYKKLQNVKDKGIALLKVMPFNASYSPHGN